MNRQDFQQIATIRLRIVHVEREAPPQLMRLASIEGVPVDEAYVYRSI